MKRFLFASIFPRSHFSHTDRVQIVEQMIYPFINPVYALIHIPAGSGQVDHLYQKLSGDTFHIYREMIILIIVHNGVMGQIDVAAFFSITFCECLPTGKYVLTVWGGMPDDTSLTDAALTHIIHANGKESVSLLRASNGTLLTLK